jgi:hypothetical protein
MFYTTAIYRNLQNILSHEGRLSICTRDLLLYNNNVASVQFTDDSQLTLTIIPAVVKLAKTTHS